MRPLLVTVAIAAVAAGCSGEGDVRAPPDRVDRGPERPARTSAAVPTRFHGRPLSVLLTRTRPAPLAAQCDDAAAAAGRPIVCPALLPEVPIVRDPNLHGGAAPYSRDGFYVISANNGENGRALHFIVGLGSAAWLDRHVFDDRFNTVRGRPRRLRDVTVDGETARVYRFFGGANAGHVGAVVDRADGTQAFASMHGRRYTDVAVLMAVDLARQPASWTAERPLPRPSSTRAG